MKAARRAGIILLLGLATTLPIDALPRESRDQSALEEWKLGLAELTRDGGTWRASNEEYADTYGIETFGMRYTLQLGEVSSIGCLWGESDGRVIGVYWHFFQGWDPVEARALVYQTGVDGTVGIGHETARAAGRREMVQTFAGPDGQPHRIRHVSTQAGDTLRTRSFDDVGGSWTARRGYTWVRGAPGDAPC